MNTSRISHAIDGLLDKHHWTQKELDFYNMLFSKVRDYHGHFQSNSEPDPSPPGPIQDLSEDIVDIGNNIATQAWYIKSNNQGTITSLYQNMNIIECIHQKHPSYQYKIDLMLRDGIHLVINVARDTRTTVQPTYHFRIYYELGGNKGHVAAFTPGQPKGNTLPEYSRLKRILPSLTRYEIVCFAIEMMMYYDVDNIMTKLPMGNNYPITLQQLIKGITDELV